MTVDELRDWAILGRIVERVEEQKRFCGETLLQKSAYFAAVTSETASRKRCSGWSRRSIG
jgi:hypothetical protein